jgi:hypothetical protein
METGYNRPEKFEREIQDSDPATIMNSGEQTS